LNWKYRGHYKITVPLTGEMLNAPRCLVLSSTRLDALPIESGFVVPFASVHPTIAISNQLKTTRSLIYLLPGASVENSDDFVQQGDIEIPRKIEQTLIG